MEAIARVAVFAIQDLGLEGCDGGRSDLRNTRFRYFLASKVSAGGTVVDRM